MKVLVTGHNGYIGSVMVPVLQAAGHDITGLDTFFFSNHHFAANNHGTLELQHDIRTCVPEEFDGFDAVIHLAALSNDPLGELNAELTFDINHKASLYIAQLAKDAGVQLFLYASTCSVYGVANQEELATEQHPLRPVSAYAISKVRVEEDLAKLADGDFSPVFLRNATAYGWSPHFRADLVLNNLAGWAYTTGEICILSDGTPWRPLVHVQDIANAFAAALEAPREAVHNQAFNVGVDEENYQVRDLAEIVQQAFEGSKVIYAEGGGPDPRSYRVDFGKIKRLLPGFKPVWNARLGVEQLRSEYQNIRLTQEDFTGIKYVRLAQLKSLLKEGKLDDQLYWKDRVIFPQV
jgi:nucleoside-diphosphate-sugar epimerase